jgi:hypothetical protein
LRPVFAESGKFVAILARIEVANGFSLRKLTNNASSLPCDTFFLPVPCFFPMVPVCANLRFANNTVFLSKGCFFKFGVEVGVELSIVNALYRLRITGYAFTRVVRSQSTLQRLLRRQI